MNMQAFTKTRIVVLALVAMIVVSVTTYVVAVTTTGEGAIKKFDGVQVAPPDFACTTSFPGFEDMPGMSLPFTMHGKGRVVILFQGQFGGFTSTPDARAIIRLTIDGIPVGAAAAIANDHGTGAQTFGFNAFSDELGPGTHTAQVLWHTAPGTETSCVEERSLIILHQ
jgi:hypothetical protein